MSDTPYTIGDYVAFKVVKPFSHETVRKYGRIVAFSKAGQAVVKTGPDAYYYVEPSRLEDVPAEDLTDLDVYGDDERLPDGEPFNRGGFETGDHVRFLVRAFDGGEAFTKEGSIVGWTETGEARVFTDNGEWTAPVEDLELVTDAAEIATEIPVSEMFLERLRDEAEVARRRHREQFTLDLDDGPTYERHPLSERFHETLNMLGELHDRKQADYGVPDDPFYNIRASEQFGIPGWVGAVLRGTDKVRRLEKAARQVVAGEPVDLANEGVEDSLLDLAVYAVIAYVMFRETV